MRHDVAIYSPFASGLYERRQGNAGGAERQMTFLAHAHADRGPRVAHIVYDVRDPSLPSGHLTLESVHSPGTAGARWSTLIAEPAAARNGHRVAA
jgi:hypothetical protein